MRFNSEEEIREKNLLVGQTVFYAPNAESMTNFVFVSKIQRYGTTVYEIYKRSVSHHYKIHNVKVTQFN